MSFHETWPYVGTGVDHVCPWFVDFVKTTLNPFMYSAYTGPVFGTTSMIGSNCPEPLQAHSGAPWLQVAPPSEEISSAIHGDGQLPGQGLAA